MFFLIYKNVLEQRFIFSFSYLYPIMAKIDRNIFTEKEEIKLCSGCFVTKTRFELIIHEGLWLGVSRFILFFAGLSILLVISLIGLLVQVVPPTNLDDYFWIYFCISTQIVFTYISFYSLYYYFSNRGRKTELRINRIKNEIKYNDIFPKFRELRRLRLSDVNSLEFYRRPSAMFSSTGYLKLGLEGGKDFRVLRDTDIDGNLRLGKLISEFIHQPLIFQKEKSGHQLISIIYLFITVIFFIITLFF